MPEPGTRTQRHSERHRERHSELRRLFDEIVDLPAGARAVRLEELCSDTDMRREVLEIAEANDVRTSRATRISGPMADIVEAMAGPELRVGDVLGSWKLTAVIGEGGMGAVFLAERNDGHFQQQAAVKLLQGVASKDALELLARERQILASLSHPNIARLLDGGATPKGRPYLVMEFVDGKPLDVFLRERKPGLKAALRLFAAICETIAFAHARLVIHCDIKPSNILVDNTGRAVLLDFGVATSLGSAERDGAGNGLRAYTPRYASPEMKSGEAVGVASDVYSLGVVLREILEETGGRNPDLDAIVARATAEDPARRYGSVPLLALDVSHYLDGLPVAARAGGGLYVTQKWLRRRWPVALALAAFVFIITGFTWQLAQERNRALESGMIASRERDGANAARADAEAQRDRAVAAETTAHEERDRTAEAEQRVRIELARALSAEKKAALAETDARRESVTAKSVNDFLLSIFSAADPERNQGKVPDVLTLINRAEERIGRELKDQPASQASMYGALATVYENLGQPARAEQLFDKAIATERTVTPARPLVLANLLRLAGVLKSNSLKHLEAEPLAREAIRLLDRHDSPDGANIAHALVTLGLVLTSKSELAEAEQVFLRAARNFALRKLEHDQDVSAVWHNLGRVYQQAGNAEKAAEFFKKSLDAKAPKVGERHPRYLTSLESWALARTQLGHLDEAENALRKAAALRREIHGANSEQFAISNLNIGRVLVAQGRYDEALEAFATGSGIDLANHGARSMIHSQNLIHIGGVHLARGDIATAESTFREVLSIRRERQKAGPDLARAEFQLGRLLASTGRVSEGLPLLTSALKTLSTLTNPSHPDHYEVLLALALAQSRSGDLQGSREHLARAGAGVQKQLPLRAAEFTRVAAWVALAEGDKLRAGKLMADYEAALKALHKPEHPALIQAAIERAEISVATGNREDAERTVPALRSRLAAAHKAIPPASSWHARVDALGR